MRKMIMTLVAMLTIAATGKAMSYEQARNEALFLTDKMAYELNLTDEQYEAAYEINLDYLMGVTSYDDVYSTYWERRNLDMSYILLDWQWQSFINASYFYRPLYWDGGYWHFGIYARYPHRDYFYFGRPVFYASYRGGHAWHRVGGHGYYYTRRDHFRPAHSAGHTHFGMLDRWNRGDFHANHHTSRPAGHNYGGNRHSSTRTTATGHRDYGHNYNRSTERHNNIERQRSMERSRTNGISRSSGSFGGYRDRSNATSRPSSSPSSSIHSGSHNSSGSFSGSHSSGSFSGSRSSGSFSGSRSSGSFSSGGGHSSSHSGGHSSSGGRSFGGRR